MSTVRILRAGALATLQDSGRFGMLAHGVAASGPMDRLGFEAAGALLAEAGATAIEFSQGLGFRADEAISVAFAGGAFALTVNGVPAGWPGAAFLTAGDSVDIAPGPSGNYGYVRFGREIDVPAILGSRATNVTVGLGGWKGRALRAGDRLPLGATGASVAHRATTEADGPIRVLWGLHADLFGSKVRDGLISEEFAISTAMDRMGVCLLDPAGVFAGQGRLGLVSDAIVPGDIQIVGDGTAMVLMRDHQPTGGYPRIATIVTADFDRFAQMRPGSTVRFRPVGLENAR